MGCTFIIGHLNNPDKYGVTEKEQRCAGWVNGVGDYGVRGVSAKFKRNNN